MIANTIWIRYYFCIDCVFRILQEVGMDRKVYEITHIFLNMDKWKM